MATSTQPAGPVLMPRAPSIRSTEPPRPGANGPRRNPIRSSRRSRTSSSSYAQWWPPELPRKKVPREPPEIPERPRTTPDNRRTDAPTPIAPSPSQNVRQGVRAVEMTIGLQQEEDHAAAPLLQAPDISNSVAISNNPGRSGIRDIQRRNMDAVDPFITAVEPPQKLSPIAGHGASLSAKSTAEPRERRPSTSLDEVIAKFEQMLKAPHEAWTMLNHCIETKDELLSTIAAARSSEDMSVLTRMKLPVELAQMTFQSVVDQHWVRMRSMSPDFGSRRSPVRKFVQRPQDILVTRLVLEPSLACPAVMPLECRKDPATRLEVGGYWLESANFVFGGDLVKKVNGGCERETLRELATLFSTPNKPGLSRIRSLTVPNFTGDPLREYIDLFLDCVSLRELTLGIQYDAIVERETLSNMILEDVDTFMRRTRLRHIWGSAICKYTFVKGPAKYAQRCPEEEVDRWLYSLAKRAKEQLVLAGRPSAQVWVDFDKHWDQPGPGTLKELKIDARGEVVEWVTMP